MDEKYLSPTLMIDSDNEKVVAYAKSQTANAETLLEKAVKLYYAVRDGIWYDPYSPFYLPEHYRAGFVLDRGRGYCVSKASLLCALGRACGIPSRIGFATVRNHLATKQLIEFMGSDLFVYHGYTDFYLEGKWVKATPAFNAGLCRLHKVEPLEFDGREDSVFHAYNTENKKFMEYVADHGTHSDIPLEEILTGWENAYGKDRVRGWIKGLEQSGGESYRNFAKEDVIKG